MQNKLFRFCSLFVIAALSCACRSNASSQQQEPDPIPPIGFRASDYMLETTNVRKNETLPTLLKRIGLPSDSVSTMLSRLDTVFNPRTMRAGAKVEAYYSGDSLDRKLEYAVYSHSKTKATVFKCADSLNLWNYYKPVILEEKVADVAISSSLWADLTNAGAPDALVFELADIFAWTINFFALHEGDRFRTIYTQRVCDGEVIGLEHVDYCRYTGAYSNETVCAIRIDEPGLSDRFYAADGSNLRKAFLKAPLKFTRVSSKFTMHRKHPITGQVRPHTGVDYAAPMGTPVVALGDGTVLSAAWTDNGGGNMIKIRHNATYTTAYLHLKGFAKGIRKGAKVRQGQVIGYVGSTGRSTGPHLDFRVWKNGTPIDPLKMKSPAAPPLPQEYMPKLDSLRNFYETMLENASD